VLAEIAEGLGETTNNVAEYTAAIRGLARARELGATDVTLLSDSQLLIKQLTGEYRVKTPHIRALFDQVVREARRFERVRYQHVPREQNTHADRLANLGVDRWLAERRS
jgi:ribonuclease HI